MKRPIGMCGNLICSSFAAISVPPEVAFRRKISDKPKPIRNPANSADNNLSDLYTKTGGIISTATDIITRTIPVFITNFIPKNFQLSKNNGTLVMKRLFVRGIFFFRRHAVSHNGISGSCHHNTHQRADYIEETIGQISECGHIQDGCLSHAASVPRDER